MNEEVKKIVAKAANYCSKSEHCIAEVEEKLRAWGASKADYDQIIDYLVSERFIDHSRYARSFVRDKFQFNGWGKQKIRVMLREKRVEPEIISLALEEIDEELYLSKLQLLLQQKARTLSGEDSYSRNGKLYRFALSRGFESTLISGLLKMDIDE